MTVAMQQIYEPSATEIAVGSTMLKTVLGPYKLHCRYLQSARVQKDNRNGSLMTAWGKFAIAESCYIADTGSFNAVEFNICFNQLTYCLLAQSIQDQLLSAREGWNIVEFGRRQLSDFLIVHFESTFRKPLNARGFEGRVDIARVPIRKTNIFMKISCSFEDREGGTSEGEALIVIANGHQEEPLA